MFYTHVELIANNSCLCEKTLCLRHGASYKCKREKRGRLAPINQPVQKLQMSLKKGNSSEQASIHFLRMCPTVCVRFSRGHWFYSYLEVGRCLSHLLILSCGRQNPSSPCRLALINYHHNQRTVLPSY